MLLARIVAHDTVIPRVLAAGHFLTWDEWVDRLEAALGQTIVKHPITREDILGLAKHLTDAASASGQEPQLTEEAAMIMASGVPVDDRRSLEAFGIELRPVEKTFADTIAYLRDIGRLPSPRTVY